MRKFFIAAAVAVVALLGTSSSADATFRMRIEVAGSPDPTGVVLTADGTSGVVNPGPNQSVYSTDASGFITYSGPITSQFKFSSTTGVTDGFSPTPGYYNGIDLNNMTINSSGAGTIRIILEADGFTNGPNGPITLVNFAGGTLNAGTSITFDSYAVNGSAIPVLGSDQFPSAVLTTPVTGIGGSGAVLATQTFTAPSGSGLAFSAETTNTFNKTGSYSLYEVVTITFTKGGSVSFDGNTATNPAPAGLVLALAGMPVFGLGAFLRRRRAVRV